MLETVPLATCVNTAMMFLTPIMELLVTMPFAHMAFTALQVNDFYDLKNRFSVSF